MRPHAQVPQPHPSGLEAKLAAPKPELLFTMPGITELNPGAAMGIKLTPIGESLAYEPGMLLGAL